MADSCPVGELPLAACSFSSFVFLGDEEALPSVLFLWKEKETYSSNARVSTIPVPVFVTYLV